MNWYCPNCGVTAETRIVANRWHQCAKAGGLTAPMLPEGVKAKVLVNEREDYIGSEMVQTDDNGRPVMSITTERDDGQDVAVFAPTATGSGSID